MRSGVGVLCGAFASAVCVGVVVRLLGLVAAVVVSAVVGKVVAALGRLLVAGWEAVVCFL